MKESWPVFVPSAVHHMENKNVSKLCDYKKIDHIKEVARAKREHSKSLGKLSHPSSTNLKAYLSQETARDTCSGGVESHRRRSSSLGHVGDVASNGPMLPVSINAHPLYMQANRASVNRNKVMTQPLYAYDRLIQHDKDDNKVHLF